MYQADMFNRLPLIKMEFNEPGIYYKEIEDKNVVFEVARESFSNLWKLTKPGDSFSLAHPKGHYFGETKLHPDNICPTIIANSHGSYLWHYSNCRVTTTNENCKIGTFPLDYNFQNNKPKYLIGMSVPPVMTAQVASRVYEQWLSKIS